MVLLDGCPKIDDDCGTAWFWPKILLPPAGDPKPKPELEGCPNAEVPVEPNKPVFVVFALVFVAPNILPVIPGVFCCPPKRDVPVLPPNVPIIINGN